MKHILLSISIFFLIYNNGYSQEGMPRGPRGKQMIEQEKIPFYTKKLNLTPDEAKAFWPLYNEYEQKKHDLMKQKREIGKQVMLNDSTRTNNEAQKLNIAYFKLENDELDLKGAYNEKFKKILPIQKVNKLYFVEHQFRIYLLKKLKNHKYPSKHK